MLVQLEVTICSPAAVEHLARVAAKGHWRAVRQRHTHCHPRAHMAVFWQNYVRPYAIIRWQKFVYMYHGLLNGHTEGLFYFY